MLATLEMSHDAVFVFLTFLLDGNLSPRIKIKIVKIIIILNVKWLCALSELDKLR